MAWARIDDRYCFHRKVLAAGNEAAGAHVRMIAYACLEGTDGIIAAGTAMLIAGTPAVLDRLVAARLLERTADGDYTIHDFLDYNPSAADVRAKRDALSQQRRAAGVRGAAARWGRDDGADGNLPSALPSAPSSAPSSTSDGGGHGKTMAPIPIPIPIPDPPPPPEGGDGRIERTEAKTETREARRGVTPISRGAGTHFALETFGNIAKEILDGYALVNPNAAVGDILAAVNGFAPPGLSREELVARMRFSVRRFLEQNRGNPYVKGGLQPKGWAEWLNANGWTLSKPVAVSNAPRAVPAVFAPDAKQIDPAWALAKLAELENDVDA
jgi:hypothetical protein